MTSSEPALNSEEQATSGQADGSAAPAAFILTEPARQTAPVVYASPHSGRYYPPDLMENSRLDPHLLRASEDIYVDELFAAAPRLGTPLLEAVYARAYLDVNREAWELDPNMFHDPLPDHVNVKSGRVAAGLGTIARVVASGTAIYENKLAYADAEHRVGAVYHPYHDVQARLLQRTFEQYGAALLVDCHSMPSAGGSWGDMKFKSLATVPDFIIGDRYGRSCAPVVTDTTVAVLEKLGFGVVRNDPYSGGYNTRHYGTPSTGHHAMQIEINRALYVDEETLERNAGFADLCDAMTKLVEALNAIPAEALKVA